MIVVRGEIYLEKEHVMLLKNEPEYVKKRYAAVARTLAPKPFGIIREKAAEIIGRSLRQLQRIVKRFLEEGIQGIRFRSKRPKNISNRTSPEIEEAVVVVRNATGFGPEPISELVNEALSRSGITKQVYPSLAYNILARNGEVERERRLQKKWKHFEWGRPNQLMQTDITKFNGMPILTMEDDHSRKGWSMLLCDAEDKTVIDGMKTLVGNKYENLLTDNGSQFSRKNAVIRQYCEEHITGKHIWASVRHPQTLGKLSAYQKGLKRFLRHVLGRSRDKNKIGKYAELYNLYYNNGRYHSSINTVPETRYSGKVDNSWFEKFVKGLKLENVLSSNYARG